MPLPSWATTASRKSRAACLRQTRPAATTVEPDGTARLTRAFGQAVGGTCRRYDFDFDAPASDADTLHPVCGNFLEEVTLPDSLQVDRQLRLLQLPQPAPAHGGQRAA